MSRLQEMSEKKKKKARGRIGTLLHSVSVIINLGITSCYLLAALSPFISPATITISAFFGLAFPFFLAAQVGMVIYWVLRGKIVWFIGNALLLLFTWGTIDTYIPLHRKIKESSIPQSRIKVMTYNVKGFDFRAHNSENPNPILKYIKGSGADIVCLQEAVLSRKSNSRYVGLRTFKKYLPEYRYMELSHAREDRKGSGLMLLSKYPILDVHRIPYESAFNGSTAYTVDIQGRKVLVVNNHLESFRLTMADGTEYLKMVREGEAAALSRMMTVKMGPAYALRAVQADSVSHYIRCSESEHVIVCGDFNDTPISYARHKIASGLKDAYSDTGRGPGFTFNQGAFKVRIDHILYSSGFLAYNCTVDKSVHASDHFPVWCYLVFK